MRIVLQRIGRGHVIVDGEVVGRVERGYLLLVGVMHGDTAENARWLAEKIVKLRLFDGDNGTVNDRTILEVGGGILVVSQFTLAGDVRKGNRPDYTAAAAPREAEELYERFVSDLRGLGVARVDTGRFGAHMAVDIANDGPVTLILERSAGTA